jgi:hypothetical protein
MNIECGATFGAAFELLYMITPSAVPNPDIHLPVAPARSRALPVPANDVEPGGSEVPLPMMANDNDPIGEAVATGG